MRMLWDLVLSAGAGLAVAAGLGGDLGWSGDLAWPGLLPLAGGLVAGVGLFVWRRQDPRAHESPREELERRLFG